MKKLFSLMAVFFLLLTMISGMFVFNGNNKVSAWGLSPRTAENKSLVFENLNGKLTVNHYGAITIEYLYGFTELMVVTRECSEYYDADSNPIENGDYSKAVSCSNFNGKIKIIHMSGAYNEKASGMDSKTIHLYKYIPIGKMVQVQFVFSFMDSKEGASTHTGLYYPLYCNLENNIKNCKKTSTQSKSDITSDERVKFFVERTFGLSTQYDVEYYDRRYLVYQNTVGSCSNEGAGCTTESRQKVNNSYATLNKNDASPKDILYIQVDNSNMSGTSSAVEDMVYDTIIPVLITILFIAAGVSIAILGYKIIKSADEPQERRDKIVKLRNILIGIGIALLLLFAANPVVTFIKGLIEES